MIVRVQRIHLIPLVIFLMALLATASLQTPAVVAQPVAKKEIPHGIEGKEDCLLCHKGGGVKPVPAATHASFDNTMCTNCHKLAAAVQPTQAPAQPTQPAAPKDTPHPIEGKEDCLLCHQPGGVKPVPATTHASYTNAMCLGCHKLAPSVQPTTAPTQPPAPTPTRAPAAPGAPSLIPHSLEGRAACSTCHGIAGAKPYPKDHIDRPDSGCLQCHVVVASPRAPTPGPTTLPPSTDTCLTCHRQTDLSMTLSSGQRLSLYIDGEQFAQSIHGSKGLTCLACHPSSKEYPHPPVTAATARELNRGILQEACAGCHQDVFAQYKDSVHGKALIEEKNLDVPSCTDCHGVHNIRDPRTSLFRVMSPDLCSTCHANARLMAKYGISPNVTKTYLNDFHGATVRLSRQKDPNITTYKAVCYDCHGIHDIKKTDDPASAVVKANLVKTCQKCHPDADTNFPAAWTSHYEPNLQKWPLVYFVNLFYSILIPVTIGSMVAYISLDVGRTVINKRRSRRAK